MDKNILIIGPANSIHIKKFIEVILKKNNINKIIIFNMEKEKSLTFKDYEYFKKENIKIINSKLFSGKNKIFMSILNFFSRLIVLYKALRKEKIDYCLIHFCSLKAIIFANIFKGYFKYIIPIFWGSDVLRNKNINNFLYFNVFKNSKYIIMPNLHTKDILLEKINYKFKEKIKVIMFPSGTCEKIDSMIGKINIFLAKEKFNFPKNKKIILCGHTATRAEQYEKLIKELNKCSKEVLKSLYFIFMMTYGDSNKEVYQKEIENLLKKSNLNYQVLKNYIDFEDILYLHFASDIHISTIKTDAFSFFFQEELLVGNIVIYGKWLNYKEIEKDNFFAISFNEFIEISTKLDDVIKNFSEYRLMAKKNKDSLFEIQSNYSIIKQWNEIFEE